MVAARELLRGETGRLRLRTLVFIRWIAVVGQFAAVTLVHWGLGFKLPIVASLLVIGVSAAMNLVVSLTQPMRQRLSDRVAAGYLAFDMVQLSALLYFTGGLQNPFAILIVASVAVSATVLSRGTTISLGVLAGVCVTVLALIHEPFPWQTPGFALPDFYIMGIWQALVVSVLFIAAFIGSVAEEARAMTDALAETRMALAREQRLSELGALAAAAAHELGSPLATIAVVAKEMKRDIGPDSPLAGDVDLLIEQSDRCREILAQLSARPEAEPDALYPRMVATALLNLIAAPYRLEGKPIEVRCAPHPDTPDSPEPHIVRTPEILHALGTLIQNAAQFAATGVTIEARWTPGAIRIAISDDGPGFPPPLLDRLGEPYVSTRDEGGEHMGLGIFIAQTLLGYHGATLSFANRESGGAVVTVDWKRSEAERLGREPPARDAPDREAPGRKPPARAA